MSDTPLGEVVVPLADIDPEGGITDRRYPIKKVGRMEKVSGEVYIFYYLNLFDNVADIIIIVFVWGNFSV